MYTPSCIKRENQFTEGHEYMTSRTPVVKGESVGYVGYYNITSEGPFTGKVFTPKSKILFSIKITNTKESSTYVELATAKGKKTDLDYADPILSIIEVTVEDKRRGYFLRYFIQQRNDVNGRIKEIDKKQHEDLLKTDKGMNPSFYKSVVLRWKITGPRNDKLNRGIISIAGIEDTNKRTVQQKEFSIKGLLRSFANRFLEYSEYDPVRQNTNTDIKL